jgi:DNA repair photolyase
VKDLFRAWLTQHLPERAAHVMSLVQSTHGGQDNETRFGQRMAGTGAWAALLRDRFHLACRRLGLNAGRQVQLNTSLFRAPAGGGQLRLEL